MLELVVLLAVWWLHAYVGNSRVVVAVGCHTMSNEMWNGFSIRGTSYDLSNDQVVDALRWTHGWTWIWMCVCSCVCVDVFILLYRITILYTMHTAYAVRSAHSTRHRYGVHELMSILKRDPWKSITFNYLEIKPSLKSLSTVILGDRSEKMSFSRVIESTISLPAPPRTNHSQ